MNSSTASGAASGRGPCASGLLLACALLLAACQPSSTGGAVEGEAAAAGDSSSARSTRAADRRGIQQADSLAERLIAGVDSAFAAVAGLSVSEQQRLRRYLQDAHMVRARRFGIDPVPTRRAAAALMAGAAPRMVKLQTNDFHIIDPRMGYAVPLVVPSAAHLLARLGQRFQKELLARGLPPYRFILTNVLRTGQDQAALSGVNVNAAQGQSTHEYGTTFDVYYERFHYAAVHDSLAARMPRPPGLDEAHLRQRLRRAYRRFGQTQAPKLKAVLGRVLLRLQEEGLLLAIYERQQAVFHLTVARDVEAPPPWRPAGEEASAVTAEGRRFYANLESQLSDVDNDLEELEAPPDSLAALQSRRDRLWERLPGLEEAPASAFPEVRAELQQSEAALQAAIERTRIRGLQTPGEVRGHVRTWLQETDRAISQLEGLVESAGPDRPAGAHREQIADLRAQHDALGSLLEKMSSAAGDTFRSTRAEIAQAVARLGTDLQIVAGNVAARGG